MKTERKLFGGGRRPAREEEEKAGNMSSPGKHLPHKPESDPGNPTKSGRKEQTPPSCPLTFACVSCIHIMLMHEHTHTLLILKGE